MRRRIAVLSLLTVIVVSTIVFFSPLIKSESKVKVDWVKELPEAAYLAVKALNESSSIAYDSLWVEVNETEASMSSSTALEALDKLEMVKLAANTLSGSIKERILGQVNTYRRVASASINASLAGETLNRVRPKLREALDLLIAGEVGEALSVWREVRGDVLTARERVGDALNDLMGADEFISESHRQSVGQAEEKLQALAEELDQIISLFQIAEKHGGKLEKALKSFLNGEPMPQGLEDLVKDASRLDAKRAGRYAYYIQTVKDALNRELRSKGSGNQECSGKGGGAGRKERRND